MVFTKEYLAVIAICFIEQGWTGTLNPLDYSTPCLKKLSKIVFIRTSSNFHQF